MSRAPAVHYTAAGSSGSTEQGAQVQGNETQTPPRPRVNLSRPSDHYQSNPYAPPSNYHGRSNGLHGIAKNFIQDPLTSTLSAFSNVTNFIIGPTAKEEFENLIEAVQPGNALRGYRNEGRSQVSSCETGSSPREETPPGPLPPPSLPAIPFSEPQNRLEPLSVAEYVEKFSDASRQQLMARVFKGAIEDNVLRRRLWPLILGLTEENQVMDWSGLDIIFDKYKSQWESITPDQETRFTAYRERKSIIDRDVVRCDRTHHFYREEANLEKLRTLLLTYVMYDFDTGYVQGMSDLASPLLYVYEGDVMKAFWCFVQLLKLIGRNFEMSQNGIKVQLELLWKLIDVTDPCFAKYLAANESKNCYFAFRWLVCQFKREFMKEKDDDYNDCLAVWETIWCSGYLPAEMDARKVRIAQVEEEVTQQHANELEKDKETEFKTLPAGGCEDPPNVIMMDSGPSPSTEAFENGKRDGPPGSSPTHQSPSSSSSAYTPNVSPDKKSKKPLLSDIELYVLSISLAIIRRERDLIMTNKWDACEILKHFNTLNLNNEMRSILHHAANIWFWLKNDAGELLVYEEEDEDENDGASLEGEFQRVRRNDSLNEQDFDLLNDEEYLIVNGSCI